MNTPTWLRRGARRSQLEVSATGRRRLPGVRLALPVAAGAAVFLVNNFLLARLLTALPGGTAMAATDMAAVALVVLRLRSLGVVTLMYAAYSALGLLGHLGADPGAYLLHVPRVLAAALAFDAAVVLGGYRRWALGIGLLLFAGVLQFGEPVPVGRRLVGLALAGAGLAAGVLVHELTRVLRRTSPR